MGTEVPSWGRGCSHRSSGRVFNENQILTGDPGDENILGSSRFIFAAEMKYPDKKQRSILTKCNLGDQGVHFTLQLRVAVLLYCEPQHHEELSNKCTHVSLHACSCSARFLFSSTV